MQRECIKFQHPQHPPDYTIEHIIYFIYFLILLLTQEMRMIVILIQIIIPP